MRVISLQSGSNGNCIYVEAGPLRLLFDAGIGGRQLEERLALYGRDSGSLSALFISHDHVDHSRSMGVFHRMFGLPVYATAKTCQAVRRYAVGPIDDLRHFVAGETVRLGKVAVETYPTPHDGVDGVVFVVDDGRHRLGVLTDLGHVFADLHTIVGSLDALILESNYDPDMLSGGSYPEWLKRRIRGPGGHISNLEAAELVSTALPGRMKWLCLAHLSKENNTQALALKTHRRILGERLPLLVATRYEPTDMLEV
ncbi:MAG: MBL fold metallo-hydrolase [Thermoguttaceae bacterium]